MPNCGGSYCNAFFCQEQSSMKSLVEAKVRNKLPAVSSMERTKKPKLFRCLGVAAFFAVTLNGIAAVPANATEPFRFNMVRSAGVVKAGCLSDAVARVSIRSLGPVEVMTVTAKGLPPKTNFDFFVIQVP